MIGMDRHTGLPISGIEHLRQSIADILGTPIGSRVMLPEYGSKVRRFVDLPVNAGWKSAVQAEAARALGRWEKRLKLESIQVVAVLDGQVRFRVRGTFDDLQIDTEVDA
ncbi:hypothetical protein PS862_00254 [Pseudomonas fluorescens]|uniref:IraD/Gp25-like domain-containing protein n=1 Tax=Pseudomonas fluorescens TaxID=294 RepID=A0A5E7GD50_PSEFL|nr:GPW/gp25 family protein [Pseudomonas fluorescens]VVO49839.1 hypothetical protein PS862_00254 [Pseudomonas fluorescens]